MALQISRVSSSEQKQKVSYAKIIWISDLPKAIPNRKKVLPPVDTIKSGKSTPKSKRSDKDNVNRSPSPFVKVDQLNPKVVATPKQH